MSKLAASKWLIATSVAFSVAFAIEILAKQFAGNAAMSVAKKTAGTSVPVDTKSLADKSDAVTTPALVVAGSAVLAEVQRKVHTAPRLALGSVDRTSIGMGPGAMSAVIFVGPRQNLRDRESRSVEPMAPFLAGHAAILTMPVWSVKQSATTLPRR